MAATLNDGSAKRSLNTTVYDRIKHDILTHRLRAGARLTHQQLAEDLSVSRTPVREALERLYQEGFVTHVPHRGFTVAEITRQEALEFYQMREALETFAVRFVVAAAPNRLNLDRLDQLNAEYDELVRAERMRQRMLVDREFHLTIARATGNEFLVRTLDAVFERIILKMRAGGLWTTRGRLAHEEHGHLIAALRCGKGDEAAAIMTDHVRDACRRVMEQIEQAEMD